MRENLREFIERHAPSDAERLGLIRFLAHRIHIVGGYDFDPYFELTSFWSVDGPKHSLDGGTEYIGDAPPSSSSALKCITIRPLKRDGYAAHPYELTTRIADHLRALRTGAESRPDFELLRLAYIEAAEAPAWRCAADAWREGAARDGPVRGASRSSDQPQLNLASLATRQQLIDAFGAFTGMRMSWFANLNDTPALKNARKVTGRGQRGSTVEPMFCPVEVMQWLADPKRKKGDPLGLEKAWGLLERHFPKAYDAASAADPR